MATEKKVESPTSGLAPVFKTAPAKTTLPRGGGSVKGIGESASVNALLGSASMSIPIPLSVGRAGPQVAHSLAYASSGGAGSFGAGWTANIGRIRRVTDRGVPTYDSELDVFWSADTGELVPLLNSNGGAQIEIHEGCSVRVFRPRIEGAFARVEWWSPLDLRDSFWRIISKDNVISVFGLTEGTRICDPAAPNKIAEWLLERVLDDRGNAIEYRYFAESESIVAPTPDSGDLPRSAALSKYPGAILHGNTAVPSRDDWRGEWLDPANHWLFETRFDYGPVLPGSFSPNLALDTDAALTEIVGACENNPTPERCCGSESWAQRSDAYSDFRYGFELRNQRLCRRILSFHHIPTEGGEGLVSSLELFYSESAFLAKLKAVCQVSYSKNVSGAGYSARCLPPLQFSYSGEPNLANAKLRSIQPDALPDIRALRRLGALSWTDLDADGAPGVLIEPKNGPWSYFRNQGDGRFAPRTSIAAPPLLKSAGAAPSALLDQDADGQLDLVKYAGPGAGFQERSFGESWEPFKPFEEPQFQPTRGRQTFFADLTGDGLSDRIEIDQHGFWWDRSMGERGFSDRSFVSWNEDERYGPPKDLFGNPSHIAQWADMTGDGLQDLVRIRNGQICFWPNLGHGRFGPRITLGSSPQFDPVFRFEPSRLLLADLDGSGPVDFLYLGIDGTRCWRNLGGNSLSPPIAIPLPPIADPSTVSVHDLLGDGTSCFVIESPSPLYGGSVQYLPLTEAASYDCSGNTSIRNPKPHLLLKSRNNLGGETHFHYTSSAHYCLRDRANGHRWLTKLGFPVQVISHLEIRDVATGRIAISRYRYRHGHFDGKERTFRGFAFVEQQDSVSYPAYQSHHTAAGLAPVDQSLDSSFHVPPVITKTWFHTGALLRDGGLETELAREYFSLDPDAILLSDTEFPDECCGDETRQAVAALAGSVLRQETYAALDLSADEDGMLAIVPRPYFVSERSFKVRMLQRKGDNRYAVYQVHASEQLDYHYEQQSDDPRISHQLVLAVDDWGHATHEAKIWYGRRQSGLAKDAAFLDIEESKQQAETFVQYTHRRFSEPLLTPSSSTWHGPVLIEERDWELSNVMGTGRKDYFALTDFGWSADGSPDAPKNGVQGHRRAPVARLIEHTINTFWRADQAAALPIGEFAVPLLPHQSFKLGFTDQQIQQLVSATGAVDMDTQLRRAGYTSLPPLYSGWWAVSPYAKYAYPFFLPASTIDSFGSETLHSYDAWSLREVKTQDPVGNVTELIFDYRLLVPKRLIDPNGAISEVAHDTLGMVTAMAEQGRTLAGGATETGDNVSGIVADLTSTQLGNYFADPIGQASALLGKATVRFVYDVFAFTPLAASGIPGPVWVSSLHRSLHTAVNSTSPTEISFLYADGLGGDLQTVRLADAAGGAEAWHATGRRLLNNKMLVVREFEPFFKPDWRLDYSVHGVSPTRFYDPMGRIIGVLHPDHSWEKVVFNAWTEERWDANDTCAILDPRSDTTLGRWFSQLPDTDYLPVWAASRFDGHHGSTGLDAAHKAAAHAGTPTRVFVSPLGKPFLTIGDNRSSLPGETQPAPLPTPDHPDMFHTRMEYDIEGNVTSIHDALRRSAVEADYGLLGLPWRTWNQDGGQRIILYSVDALPSCQWDGMGRKVERSFDGLRRPISVTVSSASGAPYVEEAYLYGEQAPQAEQRHLRGKLFSETIQNRSDGGNANPVVTTTGSYDWRGAPKTQSRTVGGGSFTVSFVYDATGRLLEQTHPTGDTEQRTYNLLGQLQTVTARGKPVVQAIRYNSRGQETELVRIGGVTTKSIYEPHTYRLSEITSIGATAYQALRYTYDPVGNPTRISDDAQATIYYGGSVAPPEWDYTYDSTYRLTKSRGREHLSSSAIKPWPDASDSGRMFTFLADPRDLQKVQPYTESLLYDPVGNLKEVRHTANVGSWTRKFVHAAGGNRLTSSTVGTAAAGLTEGFAANAHGCITTMPHLAQLDWDFRDQLVAADRIGGGASAFAYDACGQRAWKSEGPRFRSYFAGYERHRISSGSTNQADHTIRITDGTRLLALVEWDEPGANARFMARAPLGTLNSPTQVEVAENGSLLSYEEHYAYGGTAFQGITSDQRPAPKRYRHAFKERDELTGLYYYGGRYYPPWLGCWISPDRKGVSGGLNLFQYSRSNPATFHDPDGAEPITLTVLAGAAARLGIESLVETGVELGIAKLTNDKNFSFGKAFGRNLAVNTAVQFTGVGLEAKVGAKALYAGKLLARTLTDTAVDFWQRGGFSTKAGSALEKAKEFGVSFLGKGAANIAGDGVGWAIGKTAAKLFSKLKAYPSKVGEFLKGAQYNFTKYVNLDNTSFLGRRLSQKQVSHGHVPGSDKGKSFMHSLTDAQEVVDAFHEGTAKILEFNKNSNMHYAVVEYFGVVGTAVGKNRQTVGPSNIFRIEGKWGAKVFPENPKIFNR